MKWVLMSLLLGGWPGSVQAAEVCQVVDLSTWTQAQKNALAAVSIELVDAAGSPSTLTRWSNQTGQVCFESPTVDVANTLKPQALLDRFAADLQIREAAAADFLQEQHALQTAIETNDLCTTTLKDIDTTLDQITDLRQVVDAMKKLARCLKARGDLRR